MTASFRSVPPPGVLRTTGRGFVHEEECLTDCKDPAGADHGSHDHRSSACRTSRQGIRVWGTREGGPRGWVAFSSVSMRLARLRLLRFSQRAGGAADRIAVVTTDDDAHGVADGVAGGEGQFPLDVGGRSRRRPRMGGRPQTSRLGGHPCTVAVERFAFHGLTKPVGRGRRPTRGCGVLEEEPIGVPTSL